MLYQRANSQQRRQRKRLVHYCDSQFYVRLKLGNSCFHQHNNTVAQFWPEKSIIRYFHWLICYAFIHCF